METKGHSAIVTGGASGLGAARPARWPPPAPRWRCFDVNAKAAADMAIDIDGIAVTCDVSDSAYRRGRRQEGRRRSRPGAHPRQLRRRRPGQAHRRPRRADAARRLRARHQDQPDRHLQHAAPRRRGHAASAAARRRRARRHRQHRLRRRLRRPDRPGRLRVVERRRRRADHAGGARIRPVRRPRADHRPRHFRHADAARAAAGGAGFARRLGAVSQAPGKSRRIRRAGAAHASTTAISTARSSASTARCAWRRAEHGCRP